MSTITENLLQQHDIKPTAARRAIWQFVAQNTTHPSAEQIYQSLCATHAPVSRASVYNALRLFVEKGLLIEIQGADGFVHYDPLTASHAHFQCRVCGRLWNIPYAVEPSQIPDLDAFEVQNVDLRFFGICPDCAASHKTSADQKDLA